MNERLSVLASPVRGQEGMALISALLLLLVVSLLAVGVSMDSSMDVRGAAYQRFSAVAFGHTESGLMVGSEILEENIPQDDYQNWAKPTPFPMPHLNENPLNGVYNGTIDILQTGAFSKDPNVRAAKVIQMTGDIEAEIITQKVTVDTSEYSAINLAHGYEGSSGTSLSKGGANVIYNVEANGWNVNTGSVQTTANLGIDYRHVVNN